MRRFHGATPFAGTRTTDPDMAEYVALQEAWSQAKADRRRPYQHGYVPVRGSNKVAHVAIRGDAVTSHIRANADNLDMNFLKSWDGVPGLMDGQPATVMWPTKPARQDMRRFRGGQIDIEAPPEQRQYLYEDIHLVHQRRIHHHHAPDQVIEHGAPQHVQIGMDPTQVNVRQSGRVIEQHHERPQSALNAILWGVRKPQQQALPRPQQQYAVPQQHALPAPQAVDRGFLLPAPMPQRQPRPLAIAHQPEMPIPAPRKKSWSIL